MKKTFVRALLAVAALGTAIAPTAAHHSLSAQFDLSRPFDIKGTLSKVLWVNPHPYLYVNVEEDGRTFEWKVETVGLNSLRTKGIGKEAIKVGDTYQFRGFRARNGQPMGFLREIEFSDGRKFTMWTGNPNE
jgi:hypothetical protein